MLLQYKLSGPQKEFMDSIKLPQEYEILKFAISCKFVE